MARTFNAGSNRVDFGSATNLDNLNTITVLLWVYPTNLSSPGYFWSKTDTGFVNERFFGANPTALRVEMGRATTYATAQSSDVAITTNKWWYVGFTWDGSTAPKLFRGDLDTSVAEVASYSTSDAGSGALNNDGSNPMLIGNLVTSGAAGFIGRIASVQVFNRVLTAGEIKALQFRPHKEEGLVLWSELGWGTSDVDWSGNANTGTQTGTSVSDHVPLWWNFGSAFSMPSASSGSSYQDSLSFPSTAVISQGATAAFGASLGFPASAAMSHGGAAGMGAAASFAATATMAQLAAKQVAEQVTLLAGSGYTAAGALGIMSSVAMQAAATIAQVSQLAAISQVNLPVTAQQLQAGALSLNDVVDLITVAAMAQTGGTAFLDTIAYPVSMGLAQSASLTAPSALSFASSAALTLAAAQAITSTLSLAAVPVIGQHAQAQLVAALTVGATSAFLATDGAGNIINETITLASPVAFAATGSLSGSVQIDFAAQPQVHAIGSIIANHAIALAATAVQGQHVDLAMAESLPLSVAADVLCAAHALLVSTVAMGASPSIAQQASGQFHSALTMQVASILSAAEGNSALRDFLHSIVQSLMAVHECDPINVDYLAVALMKSFAATPLM